VETHARLKHGVELGESKIAALICEMTNLVDDKFPGFVECILVDADGRTHALVEKSAGRHTRTGVNARAPQPERYVYQLVLARRKPNG
jgi:hypothetical protein